MIKLEENIFIDADNYQFKVVTISGRDKKGENIYKALGYYSTLDSALNGYLNSKMRDGVKSEKYTSVKELTDMIVNLRNEIKGKVGII